MNKVAELRRAESLRRSGKPDKAVEVVRALVSADTKDIELRRKLAELLAEAGNKDGAISHLVKIQEHLAAQGDLLGAIASGLKVVELDPKFENPLAYVAKVKVESLRAEQKQREAKTVPVGAITPLYDVPLLKDLGPDELALVASSMKRHEVDDGTVVFNEGQAGDSLYFVTKGVLEVTSQRSKLGLVSSGQCFGEFSFLTGEPRTATVKALERSELLELSAAGMRTISEKQRRLKDVLFDLYRERALTNVLSTSPLFQVLPTNVRARLAPRFKLVELARGENAFREGEEGASLYLIKRGAVEVRATLRGENLILARLGRHQFFGEVSFLTGVPRTATVHAIEPSELLKIEEDELRELLRHHPYMREVLSRYHLDRVTATADALKAFLKRDRVDGVVS